MRFYFGSNTPSANDLSRIFTTFKLYYPRSMSFEASPDQGQSPHLELVKADGRPFAFFGPIQTLEEVYNRIS